MGLEDAIEEYLDMWLKMLGLFVRLKADVERDASEGLDSLICYYVGATTWSQTAFRYKSMSGNADEAAFEGGLLEYGRSAESFAIHEGAIEVPSVRWWWIYDPARGDVKRERRRFASTLCIIRVGSINDAQARNASIENLTDRPSPSGREMPRGCGRALPPLRLFLGRRRRVLDRATTPATRFGLLNGES